MFPQEWVFSLAKPINDFVDHFVFHYGSYCEWIADQFLIFLVQLENGLQSLHWGIVLVVTFAIAYLSQRRWLPSALIVLAFFLVGCIGLWEKAMQTFALIIVAMTLSVGIGLPLGIISSRSNHFRRVLLPILDIMQTLPCFVYLIPALMLFGLGKVPAIFATMIYAVPPLIRLTDLGIRMVDKDVIEASEAFGTPRTTQLFKIQLPLAIPNIMAGINQTTMMALSMVVIASMIGARGLGEQVLLGIQRLDVGKGMEGGFAIVVLAIILDRISQGFGEQLKHTETRSK